MNSKPTQPVAVGINPTVAAANVFAFFVSLLAGGRAANTHRMPFGGGYTAEVRPLQAVRAKRLYQGNELAPAKQHPCENVA
jgi:hypothetical protein